MRPSPRPSGYEKLSAVQTLALTEEAYLSAAEPQLKTVLESMGLADYASERVTVTLGSREVPAVRISGSINGVRIWELSAACKQDGYMASLSFTSVGGDSLDELTKLWTGLD